ncbi:MAG: methionyl-tRNA formyltransferase, partial [Proteobacteria bacterium]|nr:methionyl-tRNA formyltransferase [Pseudomonadota bacterium]
MRVIFMGTPDFAVPTLEAIVEAGHEVVLVVSQPDRKSGRGQKLTSPPVIQKARELGLPTSQPRAIRSGSFPTRYCGLEADVAVVVAYGRILTEQLLTAPKYGCVNVHASLLPRWRGAAPIQAALLAGDAVTGVSTQRMVDELDAGD